MDMFERLNRETREFNNRNVDRFNPSTRSCYSTNYDFDSANQRTRNFTNYNVDRHNPSTRGNYTYFDPCKTYYK